MSHIKTIKLSIIAIKSYDGNMQHRWFNGFKKKPVCLLVHPFLSYIFHIDCYVILICKVWYLHIKDITTSRLMAGQMVRPGINATSVKAFIPAN